jgi:hypothetical protein
MTEFKIIRALGRMTANDPKLSIDKASLEHYVQRSISEAARFATLHDHLDDGSSAMTGTPLLRELLADKRRQAIDRVFRALGILHPTADLRSVHDALMGADVLRHGAARELLETVLAPDVRGSLFAVLDELSPDARRERLGQLAPGPFATYEALLGELLDDASESLRCLAAFHIAERRLVSLREVLIRTRPLAGPQLVIHAFDQAIARLDERP